MSGVVSTAMPPPEANPKPPKKAVKKGNKKAKKTNNNNNAIASDRVEVPPTPLIKQIVHTPSPPKEAAGNSPHPTDGPNGTSDTSYGATTADGSSDKTGSMEMHDERGIEKEHDGGRISVSYYSGLRPWEEKKDFTYRDEELIQCMRAPVGGPSSPTPRATPANEAVVTHNVRNTKAKPPVKKKKKQSRVLDPPLHAVVDETPEATQIIIPLEEEKLDLCAAGVVPMEEYSRVTFSPAVSEAEPIVPRQPSPSILEKRSVSIQEDAVAPIPKKTKKKGKKKTKVVASDVEQQQVVNADLGAQGSVPPSITNIEDPSALASFEPHDEDPPVDTTVQVQVDDEAPEVIHKKKKKRNKKSKISVDVDNNVETQDTHEVPIEGMKSPMVNTNTNSENVSLLPSIEIHAERRPTVAPVVSDWMTSDNPVDAFSPIGTVTVLTDTFVAKQKEAAELEAARALLPKRVGKIEFITALVQPPRVRCKTCGRLPQYYVPSPPPPPAIPSSSASRASTNDSDSMACFITDWVDTLQSTTTTQRRYSQRYEAYQHHVMPLSQNLYVPSPPIVPHPPPLPFVMQQPRPPSPCREGNRHERPCPACGQLARPRPNLHTQSEVSKSPRLITLEEPLAKPMFAMMQAPRDIPAARDRYSRR